MLFLIAIASVYAATGTVNMAQLAGRLAQLDPDVRLVLQILLLVVFSIKAAIFPLSSWLPDSYPTAPAPVTAVFAGLLTKVGVYALIRLRSGEMRKVPAECRATIGEVGNVEHNLEKLGKAGAKRWRGIKPTVRGAAMNPVDHPHGGGEAKAGQGNPHPVTPWGVPTKGYKTRKNKRTSQFIVRDRRS